MTGRVRVIKTPENGNVVLGNGTYSIGYEIDVSGQDEDEVNLFLKQGYIKFIEESSHEQA